MLLAGGIRTRKQLIDFVNERAVFEFLADVYRGELERSPDALLDPTAVCEWGVKLYLSDLREEVKHLVLQGVQRSTEYRQVQLRKRNPLWDGPQK